MTCDLIEGRDVAIIEAKIAKYQEENAEQIMNARARKAEELAAALAASKGVPAQTEATDGGVSQSYQASVGAQGQYAPAMTGGAIGQPRPLGMAPQPVPIGGGPDMQDYVDDEEMMKLKAERGASAGGWTMELSKRRALEEAFGSIWI
ncbi:hypothetical protein Scep_008628 [Stephania cephalantha]|uniref:Cdk-activating kinase assembly factor MAT1 centre domain-containing protein n=1 Tax=Stephania cephalantha TaxID=152367 RepID=A0AAP0KC21_9MAGN